MWRKRRKWLIFGLVFVAAFCGIFFGFRAYKLRQVEKEAERYAAWLKNAVLDTNPVRVKEAFGRREPDWLGFTNIHVLLQTPTGAEFTINALIESSLTDTRLVQLDLYYARGGPEEKISIAEMAEELSHPGGIRVYLPVDAVRAGTPLDLKALLPSAFAPTAP